MECTRSSKVAGALDGGGRTRRLPPLRVREVFVLTQRPQKTFRLDAGLRHPRRGVRHDSAELRPRTTWRFRRIWKAAMALPTLVSEVELLRETNAALRAEAARLRADVADLRDRLFVWEDPLGGFRPYCMHCGVRAPVDRPRRPPASNVDATSR